MNFKKTTLKNGLTVITSPIKDSPSVTVLVMVKTGSKYETREINGLSHFLEHMCFKGTTKRPKTADISLELDSVGSHSNAFTSHEFTGYYAKAHPKHLDKILDVVSDIYLNPLLDQNEIDKEKGVIVEEIHMYEDMPQHVAHDLFMEVMYGDQPAGWNIAGTPEIVHKLKRNDFVEYRKNHYVAPATVVLVSGDFNEQEVISKIENAFKNISLGEKSGKLDVKEEQTTPQLKIKQKETDQTHIVIGVRTFPAKDKRDTALKVLNAVLGSNSMSSRLFLKLREEMGVGYYVRSHADEYTDHGILTVSTGVDTKRVSEVVEAVLGEMKKLREEKVGPAELQKAKDYAIGNMYLDLESSDSLAEFYAVQEILSDEILTPAQLAEKIQNVTAEQVMALAQEIMRDEKLNMAIIGNIKDEEGLKSVFHF